MGKKGKKGKKKAAKENKPDKDKKPSRPTRCGPDFKWSTKTKLVDATLNNDVYRVKRLLVRGAEPNEALHRAIGRGKLGVVDQLLAAGADVHTEILPGDYYTPPIEMPEAAAGEKGEGGGKGKKGGGKKGKKKKK